MQPGICLQADSTVCFRACGKAGKASDAFSVIGNDKVIHKLPIRLA
jgi:hypothetical protein